MFTSLRSPGLSLRLPAHLRQRNSTQRVACSWRGREMLRQRLCWQKLRSCNHRQQPEQRDLRGVILLGRQRSNGIILVIIGLILLLVAYTGNPAQLFGRFVSWLGGGSSSAGVSNVSTSGLGVSQIPGSKTGTTPPPALPSTVKPTVRNNSGTTTVLVPGAGGKKQIAYVIPSGNLTAWGSILQWVRTHDPFWNSGPAS